MKKLIRMCPKCGSEDIATERRPNSDSICGKCNYKDSTGKFDIYDYYFDRPWYDGGNIDE